MTNCKSSDKVGHFKAVSEFTHHVKTQSSNKDLKKPLKQYYRLEIGGTTFEPNKKELHIEM